MDLFNPKIAISNHLRACCCGHVAQYELHIGSEQICICICNMYMYMEMHMFNIYIYIHIMEIRRFLGDVYSSNCHGLFLAKVFCKWKYWIFGLPWNGGGLKKCHGFHVEHDGQSSKLGGTHFQTHLSYQVVWFFPISWLDPNVPNDIVLDLQMFCFSFPVVKPPEMVNHGIFEIIFGPLKQIQVVARCLSNETPPSMVPSIWFHPLPSQSFLGCLTLSKEV